MRLADALRPSKNMHESEDLIVYEICARDGKESSKTRPARAFVDTKIFAGNGGNYIYRPQQCQTVFDMNTLPNEHTPGACLIEEFVQFLYCMECFGRCEQIINVPIFFFMRRLCDVGGSHWIRVKIFHC